jgi:hypothetical protein
VLNSTIASNPIFFFVVLDNHLLIPSLPPFNTKTKLRVSKFPYILGFGGKQLVMDKHNAASGFGCHFSFHPMSKNILYYSKRTDGNSENTVGMALKQRKSIQEKKYFSKKAVTRKLFLEMTTG